MPFFFLFKSVETFTFLSCGQFWSATEVKLTCLKLDFAWNEENEVDNTEEKILRWGLNESCLKVEPKSAFLAAHSSWNKALSPNHCNNKKKKYLLFQTVHVSKIYLENTDAKQNCVFSRVPNLQLCKMVKMTFSSSCDIVLKKTEKTASFLAKLSIIPMWWHICLLHIKI